VEMLWRSVGVLLMIAMPVRAVEPAPAEMDRARRWVAAKFEGVVAAPSIKARIEVVANHGPVQVNARGGKPMRIADKQYTRGLYCHANSKLIVHLPAPGKAFSAIAGVDTNDQTSGGRGSVVFAVRVHDEEAWRSDVMREGMAGLPVSVDLGGATEFVLEIGAAGDGISCDQSDWLDAKVTLADGRDLWLGDLPLEAQRRIQYAVAPFFSFTYDGRASIEFLSSWQRDYASRKLDEERTEHTLVYTDPDGGLVVRCVGIEYHDFPSVEWTLHFKNTGAADTPILADIQPLDIRIERDEAGEFVLHRVRGDDCTPQSYEPLEAALAPSSQTRIANTGGRPTQIAFPYFNIAWPGEGLIAVLSWAGQWAADFLRDDANALQLRAGQELTHFTLHPGEEVRTPMAVLQFYQGDWLRAQNVWRRWMFAHNLPKPGGEPLKPQMSLCTGNFYPNLMTEAVQERAFLKRHIEEGIDFDCWWQDAGWYPCDGVGWPKTGTWEVDPVRFPNGLRELSDFIHTHGKIAMVWFEPERVHPGTWITDNHPEWVHGGVGGGLLKLGEPACREWLTDHVDRLLTEQGIDYYRQDFNIDPLAYWRANDAEDRQGITEIRHVEGYLAYWDALIRRHPNMLIDSCASGGRRNDLETLRRAVPLLRSDWYWGEAGQQCLTYGLSLWIPYHGTGFIYEKDAYWVRSGMVAEMSFGPGAEGLENVDFSRLRRLTNEWRQIAPCFLGDYYPLTSYTRAEDQWMAWQFDRPDLGEGVVQAFRRAACPYLTAQFPLHALDPDARYAVRDFDGAGPVEIAGRELMQPGLTISIQERPAAAIVTYTRVK